MRRLFVLPLSAILLCGCATMTASSMTSGNRMNLARLSLGMSRSKALAIMGRSNCMYSCDLSYAKPPARVRLNNPYRTEILQTTGRSLEVVYYVTGLKDSGCTVNDDGLTPLVFENSKLIGWGNEFLTEVSPGMQMKQGMATAAPDQAKMAAPSQQMGMDKK